MKEENHDSKGENGRTWERKGAGKENYIQGGSPYKIFDASLLNQEGK